VKDSSTERERKVLHLPSNMTTDVLADLEAFELQEEGERQNFRVPELLKFIIEAAAALASPDSTGWCPRGRGRRRMPLNVVSVFCLERGLPLLHELPGVDVIVRARHAASALGAREIRWHSSFTVDLEAGRTVPLQLRVPRDLLTDATGLASALGLPAAIVVTVSMALVLVDCPLAAADLQYLREMIERFRYRLSERANEVVHHMAARR
jgi:hypothetical protein